MASWKSTGSAARTLLGSIWSTSSGNLAASAGAHMKMLITG
jgi:hypothetical protein